MRPLRPAWSEEGLSGPGIARVPPSAEHWTGGEAGLRKRESESPRQVEQLREKADKDTEAWAPGVQQSGGRLRPPSKMSACVGSQQPGQGAGPPRNVEECGLQGSSGQKGLSCVCPPPRLLGRRRREACSQPRPAGQKSSAGPAGRVGWARGGGAVQGTGWPGRGCLGLCDRMGGLWGKRRPLGPDS